MFDLLSSAGGTSAPVAFKRDSNSYNYTGDYVQKILLA